MGGVPVRIEQSSGGMSASGLDDAPGIRVLFVYPTYRNMLSPAIGLLAAVLTQCGHEVRLFGTAYYAATYGHGESMDADVRKSERLQARPYEMPEELQLKTDQSLRRSVGAGRRVRAGPTSHVVYRGHVGSRRPTSTARAGATRDSHDCRRGVPDIRYETCPV